MITRSIVHLHDKGPTPRARLDVVLCKQMAFFVVNPIDLICSTQLIIDKGFNELNSFICHTLQDLPYSKSTVSVRERSEYGKKNPPNFMLNGIQSDWHLNLMCTKCIKELLPSQLTERLSFSSKMLNDYLAVNFPYMF